MAGGDTPARGAHSGAVRGGLNYILSASSPTTGRIVANDVCGIGPIYDHACATLFLAEVYGMCRGDDDDLMQKTRETLQRAIGYLDKIQNKDGGYGVDASDLAVTAMCWMAIRAAHNAGVYAGKANLERLEAYVAKCRLNEGGFALNPGGRAEGQSPYPTSAGLRILMGMGKVDEAEVDRCAKVIGAKQLGEEYGGRISEWDYCGVFFAVQAMMLHGGDVWRDYCAKTRDYLVKIQNEDGSWTIEYCLSCRAYATALACIVLQTPNRLLPMFQL